MSNFANLSLPEKEEIIALAAQAGAQIAMKKFDEIVQSQRQKRSDKRLHRTDLLMKEYRKLKSHIASSIYEKRRLKETAIDILDEIENTLDDDLYIESIKKSTQRTMIILKHVDKMLEIHGLLAEKSKNPIELRRHQVMMMRYVDESMPTIDYICRWFKIDRSCVYDDINSSLSNLTSLIFGIDGLK